MSASCDLIPGSGGGGDVGFGGGDLPGARINGVAGDAVSYCWGATCVDGAPELEPRPELPEAERYQLEVDAALRSLTVTVRSAGEEQEIEVNDDLSLGPIPDGEWEYLLVQAFFGAGDALYAWSLP